MLVFNFRKAWLPAINGMFSLLILNSCTKEIKGVEKVETPVESMSSKANQADQFNTFYGPQVHMGNGKARSFFTISHTGVPQELGIEMTEGVFSGISEDHALASFVLPLHHKAQDATPFEHVYMNWNANGHPPFAIFGVPHFDFHFYTTSSASRMAIPEYTPTPGNLFDILPPVPYRPAGFVPTPGGEPQMGKHWVDVVHPVAPGTFTHTMIYGSYNGQLTFVEPMITRAFLQSGATVSVPYGQPAQFQETGTYYPTVYNIRDDASGKHYVTLSNFVLR
jgi:hypothetical protein